MQAIASFTSARVAGRYSTLELVGTGGMARVYRSLDESSGRIVALKQLTSTDANAAALFEAEFHTLAGLRHPAIIEVYDYGVDASGPYYTMELLDGRDVARQAPLPWKVVCECLRDVGSALALVHRRELVHRDITPRNVWRTQAGAFKMIDFGALTRFGVPEAVVGTPAFMAPEGVLGVPLDQRADLYSLGAVAYFLLTGRNAHPARTLEDVVTTQPKPQPPSFFGKMAGVEIPPELDELVLSLLSRTPLARPSSAAEVIERACAIAGLSADNHSRSMQPHLVSTQFVGRAREGAALGSAIVELEKGRGGAVLVEGAAGSGKSRILQETKLDARLAGTTVLSVEARLHPEFHGAAIHLAGGLLDSLPDLSRVLAEPHADVLSHLSGTLKAALGRKATVKLPAAPGEARMRIQDALLAWFQAVSQREKLVVFVDDVDHLDEGSAAFVAALALASRDNTLLVVATRSEDDTRAVSDSLKAFRAAARVIRLPPLERAETRALLRSAFGDVQQLPRLADKLHDRSDGNPQRCMDLVAHLVRHDIVHHQGGAWILPIELRDEQLPDTFDAVLARHFERLSSTAKTVTRVLQLHRGVLSVDALLGLLDDEPPGRVSMAVDELFREGVASGSRTGMRLVGRYAVHAGSLDTERARTIHRKLGEAILSRPSFSTAERLEAGLHLLRAGDEARAGELLARGGMDITAEPDSLPAAISTLEAALEVYKGQGRSKAELAPLLAPLASGGYYVDHRLARRYGEEALDVLQGLLRLDLAGRLRKYLGRKISLYVAIISAAIRLKKLAKTKRTPSLREAFLMLFTTVSTLTGVNVIYIDRDRALRFVNVLEPLTALGKDHVASFMYEFSRSLVMTIENASGKARASWRRMLDRLRKQEPIRDLPNHTRLLYLGGALYACGVIESWADGPGALRIAEELDAMGLKLYAMSADQVRAMYYANQGNAERFQHYRSKVEMHAIARGTAWQVEIWSHGALISTHLRGHDAMGMKHTRDVLERLARDLPSLSLYGRRARGTYSVMRGRWQEGIPVLEAADQGDNKSIVGAYRAMGVLARAYNQTGNPQRAKELCLDALARMDADDKELVAMNLIVSIELAIAEARLGNFAEAERSLDALIAKHRPLEGALTLGALYEARAAVAILNEKRPAARDYLEQMASWYEKTGLPSLAARSELLLTNLDRKRDVMETLPEPYDASEDQSETMLFTES